jgi:hypothetical protein
MEPVTVWAIALGMHAITASAHRKPIRKHLNLILTSLEIAANYSLLFG